MTTTTNVTTQRLEPAHDILRQTRRRPLDSIFSPKVVAVIGATENKGSVGRTVFQNMGRGGFGGTVYPVNPKRSSVLCVKAYPAIRDVPEKVDLAVLTTPAATAPGLIRECADAGVPAAVIDFRRLQRNRPGGGRGSSKRSWRRRGEARCASSARTAWGSWSRTTG